MVECNQARRAAQVKLAQACDIDRRAAPLAGHSSFRPWRAASAAAAERALLVLEHERGKLAQRVIDVAFVHDPIGRKLGIAHPLVWNQACMSSMLTAMVSGCGFTTSSGFLKFTACPPSSSCAVKGGIVIAASIALLLKATAYCVKGMTLMSTSLRVSPSLSRSLPTS